MLPYQLYELGQDVAATVLFVSNIFFWSEFGYFDSNAVQKPLLHSWSLSVEEQFYVVFPLLLWALTKYFPQRRFWLLGAIALSSFLYSAYLVRVEQGAAFYLSPSRAWEFALGSLLAVGAFPKSSRPATRECLAFAGAGLLLFGIWGLSRDSMFPGPAALIPCVGTVLIIHSGGAQTNGTAVTRLLSMRPLVWVGLISYSLYLWHWPLLVLYQRYTDFTVWSDKIWLLCATFALAYLTWRFVEQPFRGNSTVFGARQILGYSAAAMLSLCAVAGMLIVTNGSAWRFAPQVVRTASFLGYREVRNPGCFAYSRRAQFNRVRCLVLEADKPNYLLIGDSHADHLWPGLSKMFPEIYFLQATASQCMPVVHPSGAGYCTDVMNYVYTDFLPKHRVDTVLLSARWNDGDVMPLVATVRELRRYAPRVVVVGPIIEYQKPLPELLALGLMRNNGSALAAASKYEEIERRDKTLKAALARENVPYISMLDTLCPESHCATTDGTGDPLQFDYSHLTASGSAFVAARWREQKRLP